MCYHLTSTLPKGTDTETFRQIIEHYDMAFDPINNPTIASQLRPGELQFITTKGHCDCGTVLGLLSTSKSLEDFLTSKKAQKLRKKGWDAQQITQWAEDKLKGKKKSHGRNWSPQEIEQETKRWIQFFREILQTGNLPHIGLLKHWYSGNLETEPITIKKTEKVNITHLTAEFLTKIDEDVLYEFH